MSTARERLLADLKRRPGPAAAWLVKLLERGETGKGGDKKPRRDTKDKRQ